MGRGLKPLGSNLKPQLEGQHSLEHGLKRLWSNLKPQPEGPDTGTAGAGLGALKEGRWFTGSHGLVGVGCLGMGTLPLLETIGFWLSPSGVWRVKENWSLPPAEGGIDFSWETGLLSLTCSITRWQICSSLDLNFGQKSEGLRVDSRTKIKQQYFIIYCFCFYLVLLLSFQDFSRSPKGLSEGISSSLDSLVLPFYLKRSRLRDYGRGPNPSC